MVEVEYVSYSTPKFAFISWLALHNRLATGDRILKWNSGANVSGVLSNTDRNSSSPIFHMLGPTIIIGSKRLVL